MSMNKSEQTMNGSSFQYDEFAAHQVDRSVGDQYTVLNDLSSSLISDFKLSDTNFNDIFSEFDLTTNDLQCYHLPTDEMAPIQSFHALPQLNQTFLPPTVVNSNLHYNPPEIDQIISTNALKYLIEQHHSQQMNAQLPSSSPLSQSSLSTAGTSYPESSVPVAIGTYNTSSDRVLRTHKQTPTSVPLAKILKKPEPISVTFDQFQALLRSRADASTAPTSSISTLLENSDDQGEDESPSNTSQETTKTGGQRHSSHNAIEKRYRSSINEKILELKEIVAANDEKIQKSGILRRAIEFIRQLQSTNERLEEENSTLKSILKRLNLTNSESTSPAAPARSSSKHSTSDISPSTFSSDSTDETFTPAPKRQKRSKSKPGMVNGSRLVLCGFMLCILITNPFNYLLDFLQTSSNDNHLSEVQSAISSRTLQSITDDDHSSSATFFGLSCKTLVGWMLNMAICFVCLVKLFVNGDPIVHESAMDEFHLLKKKADQLMHENKLREAQQYYRQCCEKLYVSIDDTPMYYLFSLAWQSIRLLLNVIFVGRWLTYWSGWTKSIDTRDYNRELNFCLVQLWKIDYQCSESSVSLMNFLLSTINTSINTGKKLDMTTRNEIVLLSALTLRKFDGLWLIWIPHVLKYLVPIQSEDIWLLDLDRLNEFIIDKPIDLFEEKTLLASIRSQYLQYLLGDQIHHQLLFDDESEISIRTDRHVDRYSWWQHSLQVLRCIAHERQNINSITSTDQLRQVGSSQQTIYHTARLQHIVDERYVVIIETIHRILLLLADDDNADPTKSTQIFLLKYLGQASRVLTSMIKIDHNPDTDHLELAIKTLLFDGILSLRLRLLSSSMLANQQVVPHLEDFRRELKHYQHLSQLMKLPKQRSYLFEAVFRALSGFNPLATQTLFERALKRSDSTLAHKNEPNLDTVAALLLFCHFLPSTIFRYRDLLQRAVTIPSTTKKNHDLHRLQQQCLTLIRQPYLTL